MRERFILCLFLICFSTACLYTEEKDSISMAFEIGGCSHLVIPDVYLLIDASFPLPPEGLRIDALGGFSYMFDVWESIHAGNIYFPLGGEIVYTPIKMGLSFLYYMSLSDFLGEGIFEAALRSYCDLVNKENFNMYMLFSLGTSAFCDYTSSSLTFPVTAKLGLHFSFPLMKQDA